MLAKVPPMKVSIGRDRPAGSDLLGHLSGGSAPRSYRGPLTGSAIAAPTTSATLCGFCRTRRRSSPRVECQSAS